MSLLDVIQTFKTGTYTVTRTPSGTFVAGRYVAGTPTTFPIDAVAEPTSGRELGVKAEGQLTSEQRTFWTTTQLYTIVPTNTPDSVVIDGDTFIVYRVVGPWTISGQTFYQVFAARQRVP